MKNHSKFMAKIAGTGMYVPAKVLNNSDLEKTLNTSDEWIYTRTGIRERRIANDDESSSTFAIAASKKALESANIAPKEVDLIIVSVPPRKTHEVFNQLQEIWNTFDGDMSNEPPIQNSSPGTRIRQEARAGQKNMLHKSPIRFERRRKKHYAKPLKRYSKQYRAAGDVSVYQIPPFAYD